MNVETGRVIYFEPEMTEGWTLPEWASHIDGFPTKCRSCGAPILWVVTTRSKKAPINHDGTSHFATCPQADEWRTKGPAPSDAGGPR